MKETSLPTGGGTASENSVSVPKGATLTYSLYALHRRPDIYGMDAGIFRPERWTGDRALSVRALSASFMYLPFGGGRRSCLGQDFARAAIGYTLCRLLIEFPNIGLSPEENLRLVGTERQHSTLTLAIAEGCRVRLA